MTLSNREVSDCLTISSSSDEVAKVSFKSVIVSAFCLIISLLCLIQDHCGLNCGCFLTCVKTWRVLILFWSAQPLFATIRLFRIWRTARFLLPFGSPGEGTDRHLSFKRRLLFDLLDLLLVFGINQCATVPPAVLLTQEQSCLLTQGQVCHRFYNRHHWPIPPRKPQQFKVMVYEEEGRYPLELSAPDRAPLIYCAFFKRCGYF